MRNIAGTVTGKATVVYILVSYEFFVYLNPKIIQYSLRDKI